MAPARIALIVLAAMSAMMYAKTAAMQARLQQVNGGSLLHRPTMLMVKKNITAAYAAIGRAGRTIISNLRQFQLFRGRAFSSCNSHEFGLLVGSGLV